MKKILLSAIGAVLLGAAISAFVSAKNESDDGILGLNVKAFAYDLLPGEKDNCKAGGVRCCYYCDSANYNIEQETVVIKNHGKE